MAGAAPAIGRGELSRVSECAVFERLGCCRKTFAKPFSRPAAGGRSQLIVCIGPVHRGMNAAGSSPAGVGLPSVSEGFWPKESLCLGSSR